MDLSILPLDLENIINDYVEQLSYTDIHKRCMEELTKNIVYLNYSNGATNTSIIYFKGKNKKSIEYILYEGSKDFPTSKYIWLRDGSFCGMRLL